MPDHFLPEFPAPIFLTTRPDLGDVSRGQLLTIDNFHGLFNGVLNPKQLGQALFFGKAQCATCHAPPYYSDNSPPYLHDGRLLTLEDTVEFFNLILETRLSAKEKGDLVAFLRTL